MALEEYRAAKFYLDKFFRLKVVPECQPTLLTLRLLWSKGHINEIKNCFYSGSLAHSCFDPTKYLVGASGGCYALIGAHFATVITVRLELFVYHSVIFFFIELGYYAEEMVGQSSELLIQRCFPIDCYFIIGYCHFCIGR